MKMCEKVSNFLLHFPIRFFRSHFDRPLKIFHLWLCGRWHVFSRQSELFFHLDGWCMGKCHITHTFCLLNNGLNRKWKWMSCKKSTLLNDILDHNRLFRMNTKFVLSDRPHIWPFRVKGRMTWTYGSISFSWLKAFHFPLLCSSHCLRSSSSLKSGHAFQKHGMKSESVDSILCK